VDIRRNGGEIDAAPRFEQILGVRFINGSPREAIEYLEANRGYLVVPAAPALINISRDAGYREALLESDLAIADSGFMALLWRVLGGRRISRVSGLRYLQELFAIKPSVARGGFFFILPTVAAREKLRGWLAQEGIESDDAKTYIAPFYGERVEDSALVEILNRLQPGDVIVAIGGGTQEKLGLYLKRQLSYRPAIHCIGAALAFITGDQTPIPVWADRLYLGWLLRVLSNPGVYGPRFWSARKLAALVWRYRDRLPPMESEGK
jgi:UDP-N-acetyl-D-mannosaminuronic acid transferase (WecB/TagA/CpsF family)